METKSNRSGILEKQITRRQIIKVGGLAAVGLVFSKPIIDTIRPRPAFAQNYATHSGSCTPGYWKQPHHFGDWPISQNTRLEDVFNFGPPVHSSVASLGADSFLTALSYGGGNTLKKKAQIMLRAAAAAYLNALAFSGFPLNSNQVVSQVNTALASNDPDVLIDLATDLDDKNNDGDCIFLRAG